MNVKKEQNRNNVNSTSCNYYSAGNSFTAYLLMQQYGDRGIINQAKEAAQSASINDVLEDANIAYGEAVSKSSSGIVTVSDVVAELISGYHYDGKIHAVTNGSDAGITASETEIEITEGDSKTITIEGVSTKYYVDIKGKYYEISLKDSIVSLGNELKKLPTGSGSTLMLSASSSTNNVTVSADNTSMTVTLTGASIGDSVVTVTYGSSTATINVTVSTTYTVTIQSEDTNKGTVIPSVTSQQYKSGTTITLQATESEGYKFSGWYNGETLISSESSYTYTVRASVTITGKFEEDAPDYSKLRKNSNIRNSNSEWNSVRKRLEVLL